MLVRSTYRARSLSKADKNQTVRLTFFSGIASNPSESPDTVRFKGVFLITDEFISK
jgi:hypothetical protein